MKDSVLYTFSHVHWVMEIIGSGLTNTKIAGFTLPMEDHQVISNCVNLYCSWLCDIWSRPIAIEENDQLCYQLMFQQLSLLFTLRGKINANLQSKHIELCKTVLKNINLATKTVGKTYSVETWTLLLKVLLGICDSLFRESTASYLTEELLENILWVLFESWLRSEIKSPEMWKSLQVRLIFN